MESTFDGGNNRRSYLRINAKIPIEVTYVAQGENPDCTSTLFPVVLPPCETNLPEVKDPALMQWLNHLNDKLDLILSHLAANTEAQDSSCFSLLSNNLGGGGLSFNSKIGYQTGDLLKIKLLLSSLKPMATCVYGRVINCCQTAQGFSVSVEFVNIDENIREEIIKYVFEYERNLLRQKRR